MMQTEYCKVSLAAALAVFGIGMRRFKARDTDPTVPGPTACFFNSIDTSPPVFFDATKAFG
jgi:hypothetical protein